MPDPSRQRRRQGPVRIRDGVPYANRDSSLALLSGAAIGRFLARHRDVVRGRLLDAGCGNAPYAEWYEPLVDSAVRLDAAAVPGVHVIGFADRLPFADRSFDTVLSTQVLEHVQNVEQAVADMFRVLRPGGHALVTVPYLYPTHEAPYDFRRFTHFGLDDVLRRHGFEVVALDSEGGPGLLLMHYVVLALRGFLDVVGKALRLRRPLTDNPVVRAPLWLPQELVAPYVGRRRGIGRLAGVASLGYFAVARRPAA